MSQVFAGVNLRTKVGSSSGQWKVADVACATASTAPLSTSSIVSSCVPSDGPSVQRTLARPYESVGFLRARNRTAAAFHGEADGDSRADRAVVEGHLGDDRIFELRPLLGILAVA